MSAILIRGMEMPKGCAKCPLSRSGCSAVTERVKTSEPITWIPWSYRHDDCPLVEMKDDHYYIMKDGTLYKARVATPEEMGAKTFNIKEYIENGNK